MNKNSWLVDDVDPGVNKLAAEYHDDGRGGF
jgi:hypothetical protein